MKHLVETYGDVGNCVGLNVDAESNFSRKAREIREALLFGAQKFCEDPDSLDVQLLVAKQIAAIRVSMLLKSTGYSLAELARVIGTTRETLSRIYHEKDNISFRDYQKLGKAEILMSICQWAEKQDAAQYECFMTTLDVVQNEVPLADLFSRTLFALGASFGPGGWQNFVDGHGTMTPIPAKENCPGDIARRLRAEGSA